ncbi:SEC-C metal-binding domain-containing protein [Eubacteriaceae bacterium ES3]|nr:SEC-C metal-binding domain-containing protein [Eubacteriaceae bacterium ES3]
MSLYEEWKNYIEEHSQTEEEQDAFWQQYCLEEKVLYQDILKNKRAVIEGKVSELAAESKMVLPQFMGFLDGINESIVTPLDLAETQEDSQIRLEIDFAMLYKNMLAVPAEWLYELEEWDNIFSLAEREDLTKEFKRSKTVVKGEKVGRNDPCPCGSGKKYKKCCGR